MSPDLDAIQTRLSNATPGPWVAHDLSDAVFDSENHKGWWWVWRKEALPYYGGILEPDRTGPETDDGPDVAIGVCNITDNRDGERERLDAEFIAHAPEDIAALLAAVRERDAELVKLRAKVKRLRTQVATVEAVCRRVTLDRFETAYVSSIRAALASDD